VAYPAVDLRIFTEPQQGGTYGELRLVPFAPLGERFDRLTAL
jgi:hypothetical protein